MSHTIEKLPGEPIIVATLHEDFMFEAELGTVINTVSDLLDAQAEPVYYVSNVGRISVTLNDIIVGVNMVTRGAKPVFHHPNILRNVVVVDSNIISLAVKGMNSTPFGNVSAEVFPTLDEALASIRS